MAIRPEEITSILTQELEKFERKAAKEHVGTVLQVGDGIARVYGLPDCQMGELLEFPEGIMGLALNLEEDSIGAVIIGDDTKIKEGDPVKETGRIIEIPVGRGSLTGCRSTTPGAMLSRRRNSFDAIGPLPSMG